MSLSSAKEYIKFLARSTKGLLKDKLYTEFMNEIPTFRGYESIMECAEASYGLVAEIADTINSVLDSDLENSLSIFGEDEVEHIFPIGLWDYKEGSPLTSLHLGCKPFKSTINSIIPSEYLSGTKLTTGLANKVILTLGIDELSLTEITIEKYVTHFDIYMTSHLAKMVYYKIPLQRVVYKSSMLGLEALYKLYVIYDINELELLCDIDRLKQSTYNIYYDITTGEESFSAFLRRTVNFDLASLKKNGCGITADTFKSLKAYFYLNSYETSRYTTLIKKLFTKGKFSYGQVLKLMSLYEYHLDLREGKEPKLIITEPYIMVDSEVAIMHVWFDSSYQKDYMTKYGENNNIHRLAIHRPSEYIEYDIYRQRDILESLGADSDTKIWFFDTNENNYLRENSLEINNALEERNE